MGRGAARVFVLAAVLLAVLTPAAPGGAVATHRTSPFAGLGTWVDIYSPAWSNPEAAVATMAEHGVKTLYLETGNYRHAAPVFRPAEAGRFIDAAHAAGIKVVAWYLPGLLVLDRDAKRAHGAIHFRSATGQRFNGFALDVEATLVKGLKLRDRRLLALSSRIRLSVTKRYWLGAITPSPVGMSPYYWPDIPYSDLTRYYKAFLPMAYSSLRGIHGRGGTRAYLAATVSQIRAASGDPSFPIHLIGGLTGSLGGKDMAGFMRAVTVTHAVGYSLYAFDRTTASAWRALSQHS
jgi:hypothetical protein